MAGRQGLARAGLGVPPELALETLRAALDGTATGVWDWDLAADVVRWSPTQAELHGRPRGAAPVTYDAWLRDWVHEDDRERVDAVVAAALAGGDRYELEFRSRGDPPRWLSGRGPRGAPPPPPP
ncbi:MAG: PAS domain-containing protein, partial [Solirubrobacteraceae bacterium]|nr:PAS domain-containing protein [Solirubrobacteraceae bacterium]